MKNEKEKEKDSRLFNLLSRVLFIITDEEDTRCFKSAMMFPFNDRAPFFFGL
jgi:hypothetical protein